MVAWYSHWTYIWSPVPECFRPFLTISWHSKSLESIQLAVKLVILIDKAATGCRTRCFFTEDTPTNSIQSSTTSQLRHCSRHHRSFQHSLLVLLFLLLPISFISHLDIHYRSCTIAAHEGGLTSGLGCKYFYGSNPSHITAFTWPTLT